MNNKFNEVVIVAAVRTPIGTYKGSLKNIKADQLGSIVIKEVINRTKINPKSTTAPSLCCREIPASVLFTADKR